MSESRLIVGLGNPGKNYEYTRHNLGFLVVRRVAEGQGIRFQTSSFTNALMAQGHLDQKKFWCLLPLTYMNRSGMAVRQTVEKKALDLEDVLVVCDDLHLDFGQLRIRSRGSDGGHNGLNSVSQHLENQGFGRLRLGIGSPDRGADTAEYVLTEFGREERKKLDDFVERATECCLVWLKEGMSKAMDQFNNRREKNAENGNNQKV